MDKIVASYQGIDKSIDVTLIENSREGYFVVKVKFLDGTPINTGYNDGLEARTAFSELIVDDLASAK